MEHLAIMKKSWDLTQKILDGRKTIESRWYMTKRAPFGKINPGEKVYFKDSGEPVTVMATVKDVKQFSDLNPQKVREILKIYGGGDGINDKTSYFSKLFSNKRYCILVFLKDARPIEPFEIDKTGYGMMSAWICINKIDDIKRK